MKKFAKNLGKSVAKIVGLYFLFLVFGGVVLSFSGLFERETVEHLALALTIGFLVSLGGASLIGCIAVYFVSGQTKKTTAGIIALVCLVLLTGCSKKNVQAEMEQVTQADYTITNLGNGMFDIIAHKENDSYDYSTCLTKAQIELVEKGHTIRIVVPYTSDERLFTYGNGVTKRLLVYVETKKE